jgi:putative phosphoesterase
MATMRIGILSDTHDRLARAITAVECLVAEGADVLIHCGDLCGPEIVYALERRPSYFVFGNNECDLTGLRRATRDTGGTCLEWGGIVELANKRIAVTHGHLDKEVRKLVAANPDYLLSGHSHTRHDYREGSTRRINPGALHRASAFSVALLDLESDELRFLPIER